MLIMTVTLDRFAVSFANGVFKCGDSLLLRSGSTGHVKDFFLKNCSVEIVHAITQRDLRERQSETNPIRGEVIDVVEVNTANREIPQLFECGGALDIGKNSVGLRRLERKRNKTGETASLILQLAQLA